MVIVEGKLKGKARPRVYKGRAITPKDTVTYENWVRLCYKEQDNRMLRRANKSNYKYISWNT